MESVERAMALANRIAEAAQETFGEKLTGVYLHGSLALGCFSWETGDVDLLVVTREAPNTLEKESFIRALLRLDKRAPQKGVEMSVVELRDTLHPVCPTPYALHYSNAYREAYRRDLSGCTARLCGVDPDLPAHFAVTRQRGKVLFGAPIESVFGPVPRDMYLQSVRADLVSAETDIFRDPVYVILNLCRTAAYLADGAVRSKAEGGAWGIKNLPAFAPMFRAALAAYRGENPFSATAFDLSGFVDTCFRDFPELRAPMHRPF